ncbi:hypothetical protein MUG84_26420 [Paenibacillus sp. KQZ6P-2]|uniref:Uncharacterized protein n=1 Tax=Paenibacillus mangrovi TaxID=2931978 RepID=A0A9X1WU00_9BACL|nr:hypothetical protein [Paenibacillus mangrovi]MCJ8015207.1 hypothetical protein [Paenibacillus mangrovi]
MKGRFKYWIIIFVLTIIITPIVISYVGYLKYNVSNEYYNEFKERLFSTVYKKKTFTMDEVTNFKWEKLYIFEPYLPREYMEKEVGSKWTNANSYLGYLYQRSRLDEYPLLDETYHKLVFINDDKVVLDITLDRYDIDFLPIKEIVSVDRTKLTVQKEEKNKYLIKLSE